MAAFVGAGALADNATVATQAISSHASTAVGDILIAQIYNKSTGANVTSPPDGTWTKIIEANNGASHQYTLYWKTATLAGAQSYTFTKATDDNVVFGGVISSWRVTGIDATTRGVTATASATDAVTFPAFDPTSTIAHIIYFAFYADDQTTFTTVPVGSGLTIKYDLETSTGTDFTVACCSIDSDGSSYAGRTWTSSSTTDAPNTGVVLALTFLDTVTVTQATVGIAGQTVSTPADTLPPTPGNDDVRYSSTRTGLSVSRTLLYLSCRPPVPIVAATDFTPVTAATITFTGQEVGTAGVEIIPVTSATVTVTGQTVAIGDATPPGNGDVQFASSPSRLTVRRTLLYRPLTIPSNPPGVTDTTTVTQATVTCTGKTVSILETDVTPVLKATVTFAGKTVTLFEPGLDVVPVTAAVVTFAGKNVTTFDAEVVLKASVFVTGKTVTVREAEVTPVVKATITVIGKPLTEFGLIPVNKATVTFAGQTVALVDPGVDRITVDPAAALFTGQTVSLVDIVPTLPFALGQTSVSARRTLLYRPITAPIRVDEVAPPVADLPFPQAQTSVSGRRTLLYRPITTPIRVDEVAPPVADLPFPQAQTSILARWAFLYPAGTPAPLVTPPGIEIIPVYPAGIRFTGQEVTLTGQGEVQPPIGGGGGVTGWIYYGRKQRRRYRALEEIEKRLDERIKRLETEKAELDGPQGQQVGVQLAAPDLDQFLLNFEQLLNRQAAINAALLEAQRRADLVRQERIQLAILAQRAAEAIDEEEAITMLLLT